MRALIALILVAPMAFAQDATPLHGLWGTEAQCARSLITPKGTKQAAPFDIRSNWLGHGGVWCRLNWTSVKEDENGASGFAYAVCGEDLEQPYQIVFNLINDELTLVWNWQIKNGPLQRCS